MLKKVLIVIFILLIVFYLFEEKKYTANPILIGTSIPKTSINKSWGEAVISGSNAYFRYVNDTKLLHNKNIKLIAYDDKYEPDLTFENLKKLIKQDDVFALFGLVGTPTVKKILPLIEDEKIPLFAPFTGASFLRDSSKYIINFRNSYKKEIENLIYYLYEKKSISKVAIFYQNDDYGEEGYISALQTLKSLNLTFVAEGSYKRNTLSISHAFNEIKEAKPEAIIMIGAYKANSLFIKKAKENINFKDTIFCNLSFSNADEIVKELKKLSVNTNNILFSQVVPNYLDTKYETIKEYKILMKKYYPKKSLSFTSLEAFLAAKILVQAINNIKENLNRKNLLKEIKNIDKTVLQNISISYKNNELLNKVYIFEYLNNNFKEINYENSN